MRAVSPIVPGMDLPVTVYAKSSPHYLPLPTFKFEDGTVLMRWEMTLRERLVAFLRGNVYVWLKTANQHVQPICVQIDKPIEESQ